jgi:hypothetical protein
MPDEPTSENVLASAGRARSGTRGDVPDAIRRRYFTDEHGGSGLGFYVDATVTRAAFRDRGDRLWVEHADPNAIRDVAEIAKHRGWLIVTAQGSAAFRREAWLVGRQLGLEVRGYQPTERDLQELERRRERRLQGEIRREMELEGQDDRRSRARDLRQSTRTHRQDERGGAQMRVVEAVVRGRVQDPEGQRRIMDAARARIADWLERGAVFEPARATRSPAPERQRAR